MCGKAWEHECDAGESMRGSRSVTRRRRRPAALRRAWSSLSERGTWANRRGFKPGSHHEVNPGFCAVGEATTRWIGSGAHVHAQSEGKRRLGLGGRDLRSLKRLSAGPRRPRRPRRRPRRRGVWSDSTPAPTKKRRGWRAGVGRKENREKEKRDWAAGKRREEGKVGPARGRAGGPG